MKKDNQGFSHSFCLGSPSEDFRLLPRRPECPVPTSESLNSPFPPILYVNPEEDMCEHRKTSILSSAWMQPSSACTHRHGCKCHSCSFGRVLAGSRAWPRLQDPVARMLMKKVLQSLSFTPASQFCSKFCNREKKKKNFSSPRQYCFSVVTP